MQQHVHGVEVALRIHEQRADMLIEACQTQVVGFKDGADFRQSVGRNAKLGLLAGSDDLLVVACADAGIEADHHTAAGVDLAHEFELRQRVHTDEQPGVHSVLQFFGGHVVADIQNLIRRKAGQSFHVQLTRRHGVDDASFFTDDLQQRRIGVGLGRIVDPETGMAGQSEKIPAAGPQDVFVIDIQGRTELTDQFQGCCGAVEVDGISDGRADVGHGNLTVLMVNAKSGVRERRRRCDKSVKDRRITVHKHVSRVNEGNSVG